VVGRRAGDLDEVGAGFRHEPLEGLTASKRRSAGGGADASAVLGDALEIDEVVGVEVDPPPGDLAALRTLLPARRAPAAPGDFRPAGSSAAPTHNGG
jgi:hypothetical protein